MSESAAHRLLEDFLACKLAIYESSRALARGDAVSRLSPYLHFGQISPRVVMRRLEGAGAKSVSKTFWRRLVWRDLAYWQLHFWPQMPTHSIRPTYDDQQWDFDAEVLRRWQAGETGFPLVDAGMRELWLTGYMHQNVRMVVACFLTEYLNFHWVHGARWFHDTLVDADLAINCMMWQNAGKSGLDQWNFSVLPTSKAADSKGNYIRRYAGL
jgi:deoxyribodipyrimidine photo-lyase